MNPFSPSRCAYLFHCNNISVSVKGSVGKSTVVLTTCLLLSSKAFLARILDSEKAETFGSLEKVASTFGVGVTGFTGVSTDRLGVSIVFTLGITGEALVSSTME